ncbi:WW domain-containing oxidoreductase [Durusdinium trenchii]|uniref:WW domain-containing oxidoreductase n=1 Tax=Durusdinium trenchii TaxID=1381693 RepID=A0ABP0K847_9DINO
MATTSSKASANRMAKIKALFGCMFVPYLVAAVGVGWQAVTVPALGELEQVDLRGKTVIITGSTSGLGQAQAEVMAAWNASLVLPVRDMKKGKALQERLQQENPSAPPPVVMEMDLASLESVRAFADQYTGPVDVLVHNAAVLGTGELIRTQDGFEECSQVNYLSPFLLTSLLLPRLEQSEEARIVHVQMRMLGNLGGSYADSKLAQVLFSQALARRLPANVVTHSLHPAIVQPTAQHGRNVNSSTCCLFGAYLISQCIL